MKRMLLIGSLLTAMVLLWIVPHSYQLISGQAASLEAPHIGEGGLPQFQKDPGWPKVPSKWKMGFGSAVAIDSQDHVWILSRPRTLVHPRSTAPDLNP